MSQSYFQDEVEGNYCFGCGSDNKHGLQIKSYLSGDELVCKWQPKEYHTAAPGILYGGIIASLIDCHSVWAAVVDAYRAESREINSDPPIFYVTGSLNVKYLRPTPMNGPVVLKARVKEMREKSTVVVCSLFANEQECAQGEVVAVRISESWIKPV
ncbi:MAG: PaaI family thioesterase [Thermodesulfobacteriota bacterium]|nr:PaaI family thioesterase [Thermodesulfobacteriota bacterium]